MTNTMSQIKDDHEPKSNKNTPNITSYEPPKMIFVSLNPPEVPSASCSKSAASIVCLPRCK